MTLNFSSLKALQVHSSTVRCVHHAKRTLGYFCWVTPDSDSVAFSFEKNFKFIIMTSGAEKNIIWNNDAGLENLGEVVVAVLGGGYGSSNWTFTSFRMSLICNNLIDSKNPGPGSVAQQVEQLLNGLSSPIVQQIYFLIYWFITSSNNNNKWSWIEFWILVSEVMVRFVRN